jgi:hypothetical protein
LRDFLGVDFTAIPLKPIGLRARNALKPWLIRQPQRAMSYRIETTDGRLLKLLHFGRSIADRHEMIEERLRALASLDCVPALLWSDPTNLVTEWVDGATPDADDPHFARRLAEAFAELYRVGFEELARDEVVSDLLELTRRLFESGQLRPPCEHRLEERLEIGLPERVPTGTLCGDQTLANFILTADGALSMIDPSSFRPRLPIDVFFVGSGGLYERIDRDAFHEAYAHAEGIDFPFTCTEALRLFQLARHCALQLRVLDRTPFVESRRRRNLQRSVGEKLEKLAIELR